MENNQELKLGGMKDNTKSSFTNAMSFIISSMIHDTVSTALPVVVVGVYASGASAPAGYVDIKPLICSSDADANTIQPTTIYHVPYFRLQAGTTAVVLDPVVGDVGLAVFAQRDCSVLQEGTKNPVQAGSFRTYDQADAFYIGGFLNLAPETYIELKQDHRINVTASAGVTINAPTVTVPNGDVIASGISLVHHKHTGDSGGTTGEPIHD